LCCLQHPGTRALVKATPTFRVLTTVMRVWSLLHVRRRYWATNMIHTRGIAPSWHEDSQTHQNQPGRDSSHQPRDWRKQRATALRRHPNMATPWCHCGIGTTRTE